MTEAAEAQAKLAKMKLALNKIESDVERALKILKGDTHG